MHNENAILNPWRLSIRETAGRDKLLEILPELGGLPLVLEIANDADDPEAFTAARVAGEAGDRTVAPHLEAGLRGPDPLVAAKALTTLIKLDAVTPDHLSNQDSVLSDFLLAALRAQTTSRVRGHLGRAL